MKMLYVIVRILTVTPIPSRDVRIGDKVHVIFVPRMQVLSMLSVRILVLSQQELIVVTDDLNVNDILDPNHTTLIQKPINVTDLSYQLLVSG